MGLFDDILEEKKGPEETPKPQSGLFDDILAEETPRSEEAVRPEPKNPEPVAQSTGLFDDIVADPKPQSSTPDFVLDEKLSPSQSAIARESLGRFAKGAMVVGPAALARGYGMLESAAGIPIQGEPYAFEATAGARIARGIEGAGERVYPPIPEAQGSFIPEVVGGLGQVSTIVAGGPIARAAGVPAALAPRVAAAGTGVILGAGEGAKRASEAGAKPEEVLTSGFLNGAVGLSEVFPAEKWIEKIDKATAGKFSRDVRRYFIDMGVEAGTEALQEAFQTTMGNLIAKGQYNPDQDVMEGAGKAALVGGTVGAIASGVIGGFGLSQARGEQARTQPEGLQPMTEFQRPEQTQQEQAPQAEQEQANVQEPMAIPTFEEFSGTKSNFSVPSEIPRETFRDNFGEIDVAELWRQVSKTRPQPVKVPREYIESNAPYIKTKRTKIDQSNPELFGLAEFRRPEDGSRSNRVGIRLIDGWHRAEKALADGKDFYVYPVVNEKSSIKNAYEFASNFNGFYPSKKPSPESAPAQESVTSKESRPVNFESPAELGKAFSEIGEGHRRFASRLSTMITFEAMTPDARDLILATLYDSGVNDKFLQDLEVGPLRRSTRSSLGRGGILNQPVKGRLDNIDIEFGLKPFLGMKQGAYKSAEQKDLFILNTFWHEYGHVGYFSILTPDQKKLVKSEYRKTTRQGRREFFSEGVAGIKEKPTSPEYYAKNESEWFAQSFAEWTITKKTSQTKLVPVFEKILQRIKDVFAKMFQRGNVDSLNDVYEYILKGEAYGEKPTWKWKPSKFPIDYGRPIRRIDSNFIRVQQRLDSRAGVPQKPRPETETISEPPFQPEPPLPSEPPPAEPPPSVPPADQPAPAPEPAPEPRETLGQRLVRGLDDFRRTFQDKFVDVENLQRKVSRSGNLPDLVNIKQAEELFHGRVGERLVDFDETRVNPIIEDLRNTGIDSATFEKYATAKHAKERNAVIAERNPQKPDGGSGMTNQEADRLLNGGIPKDVQAKLEPVRQRLLEINRGTLNNLLEGGLIDNATHNLLTQRYKDYVPLRGKGKEGVEGGTEYEGARITGTGSGLDIRGRDIITAGGRKSQATDIIAYAVSQHMDSIVRAEKNRVLQTAARFALAYGDNGVIENVKPSEVMKTITYAEDGQTKFARIPDPRLTDAPDIVAYRDQGVTKYLRINDPRLADVMKNRASPVLGSIIEKLAGLNRYFAFINTQASPEFVISNFARDLQTALVNINSDQAQGLARDLIKNVRPALAATFRAELGTPDQQGRMDSFYRDFKAAGGRMTFFGLRDFATLQKQIEAQTRGKGSNSATKLFKLALDKVGKLNSAVENATRLATFATLKERGFTNQQAAYAARNITVNFTRKGTAGSLMNAFYLFFNANIQGSARIVQALATSKKAQKLVLGVMVFGFFRDILNRIIGGEDETGKPIYDKIPEYQRRQNFIIMNPLAEQMGVQYFKFPMPYGYAVFDFAGQTIADAMPREVMGGGKKPMEAATSLALAALDNFNPIGGSYSLLQAISPTITTPVVDLALNQDFSGRPIMPTPNPFDAVPPPASQRYWNNVSPASKWITENLNEWTGGSKARSGYADVSPEVFDYGFEFLTGAVGKFGERLMYGPVRVAAVASGQGEVVDLIGEIPMARKLTGSVPSFVDIKRYQDVRTQVLTVEKELKLAREEGDQKKVREILQNAKPELRLVPMIKSTEQNLKELRSQRRKLQESGGRYKEDVVLERLKANRERQKILMERALKRYNSSIDENI